MKLKLSNKNKGKIAIAGHVGCGHCNSHNNFIQDDSGGLAVILGIFQEVTNLPLTIKDVKVKTGLKNSITVETVSGGIGRSTARRGITLHEKKLCQSIIGKESIRTQTLVMESFGRYYGQGADEVPVALQLAIANASLDSFIKNFPEKFFGVKEDLELTEGNIVGTIIDFDEIPVAVLGTVNGTFDGLGPIEDMEGNSAVGSKKEIMEKLNMVDIPTIVVEGKVYSPGFSNNLSNNTFMIRADDEEDNPFVASAIYKATKELGYESVYRKDVMKRSKNFLKNLTVELGDKIIKEGEALRNSEYSQEKIKILAKLAKLIQEEGAGISFMSNSLHEIIGGVGMMPYTSGVVNLVVSKDFYKDYVFPYLTETDLYKFINIVKKSVEILNEDLKEAEEHIKNNVKSLDLNKYVLRKGGEDK